MMKEEERRKELVAVFFLLGLFLSCVGLILWNPVVGLLLTGGILILLPLIVAD